MRKERLKLKPHYFWLSGIFIVGGLITSAIFSSPEASETYAYSADDEWRTLANVTYLQEVTATICQKTPSYKEEPVVYTLKDSRDQKPYTVAKLDDGNCWMTQNLRLPGGTKLTTADSDLNVGSFVKSASDRSVSTTSTDTFTLPSSTSASGSSESFNTDTTKIEMNNGDATNGAYYTWCAATAGCKRSDGQNPGANEDAGSSICPKNWKLPLSGTLNGNNTISKTAANGSFARMLGAGEFISGDSTSMSKLTGSPYNFKNTSGQYYNGSLTNTTSGYYWSRTAYSIGDVYYLNLSSSGSGMYPAYNNARYRGNSVRCVAALTDPSPYPEIPEKPITNQDSSTSTFSIEVKDAITVAGVKFTDGSGNDVILSAMPGELVNGKIDVAIGSNVAYKINLSAEKPDLTSSAGDTYKIPAITQPLTSEQLKTNYGWGVMKKTNSTTDAAIYTGLTATGETFYTSDTPAGASTATQFSVGVSVPPTLPADTYSTEVTITAIATQ